MEPQPQFALSQDPAQHPSPSSSLTRSFLSCKSRTSSRPSTAHGLGALGKIPKDLSSFLRTGSLSRHHGEIFQDAAAKLGNSAYADKPEPSSRRQSIDLFNMFSTTSGAAEERPTRKLKKENRFYNFLTRSRSRSQSNTDLPSENPVPSTKLPQNGNPREPSGSKPPHRIPSRPISSTTTATNSTITPGTPKAKRHPPSSIPVPSPRRPPETPENDVRRSRPTTPTQATARRKINIFGISISRPRASSSKSRSRSRSRPGTPQVSADIPPLPIAGFEDDSRGHQPSQSSSRAASPSPPGAKADLAPTLSLGSLTGHDPPAQAKETNSDTLAGSSKLRGFFSGKDSSRSRHQTGVPANLVSAPVKRTPSLQRHNLNKSLPERPVSHPASRSTSPDPRSSSPSSKPISYIPRIVNTPATPVRATTVSGGTTKSKSGSSHRGGFAFRNRSFDTGYRYRGTMDVVNEEGRLSKESKDLKGSAVPRPSSKGKEKESETPAPRSSISRMSASVRNTKHGSFDFERPGGLSAVGMQRTGSGGTSTTVTSGWSRSRETITNVRESTLGPGLAGVGTVQRDASVKRGKEREEKAKEMKKKAKEASAKKAVVVGDAEPVPKTNPSPAHSSGHQTPPSGTTSGKSSSLSKASGRRFFGKGSLSNKSATQHGLFSFEPPVPSPTWSTTSAGTAKEVSTSWSGRTEKEKERPRKEKERSIPALERKHSQRQDRSPIPIPKLSNPGHRSGVKGRSLDLNLGLAWAPSKVREDALLKSSSLFNRSISTSSGSGSKSPNSSAHGHDTSEDRGSEEKLKIGRETAELFRKVLGEARYMRFKTYIYQFDAHEIPFDGSTGIISKVDGLLATVPSLGLDEKRRLMDKLVRIILQNA